MNRQEAIELIETHTTNRYLSFFIDEEDIPTITEVCKEKNIKVTYTYHLIACRYSVVIDFGFNALTLLQRLGLKKIY